MDKNKPDLETRATFMLVMTGMAKELGYTKVTPLINDVRKTWKHTK